MDGLDSSDFPFQGLDREDLRQQYGLRFSFATSFEGEGDHERRLGSEDALFRGNYIAAAIQANLRKSVREIPNRSKDVAGLLNFPLELILEVFGHLHPLDLYNMIRTTKSMRNILLTRKASSLWEMAFHRHLDILPCPPDVSPPKWASLLFGPATCDLCNRGQAMVDFTYRRRLCDVCLPKYWLPREQDPGSFLSGYPEEVASLWSLVRCTHRSRAMHYNEYTEPRYWYPDLLSREQEMLPYLSAIEADAVNARSRETTAYALFKAKIRVTVLKYMEHVKTCNSWSLTIWRDLDKRKKSVFSAFCALLRLRLIKLGHNSLDVNAIQKDIVSYFSSYFAIANHIKFSKKELQRHLPELEALARNAREKRIFRIRTKRITAFYENVCQPKFDHMIWNSLPLAYHIMSLDPITAYTHSVTETVGAFSEEEVEAAIINFVTTWRLEKKQSLVRLLADSHPTLKSQGGGQVNVDEGILELATAIFYHPRQTYGAHVVIGWDEASVHLSCRSNSETLELDFWQVGYATAVLLLRLLGLDPDTTLAKDVTALNKRFICMGCNSVFGGDARTWKECVAHAISYHNDEHKPPCFALLTDEMTELVLFREPRYPSPLNVIWACRHCSVHFKAPVLWHQAVQHVQTSHRIREPIEGVNFISHHHLRSRERFTLEPKLFWTFYRCLICQAQNHRQEMWAGGAEAHLEKTHQIIDCVEGVHWRRMKAISQTTDELSNEMKATDVDMSSVGRATIVLLLRLLGLDPETALERDVTTLNRRFLCMRCPSTWKNGVLGTYAMDWKECVSHAVGRRNHDEHKTQCFALLTNEITQSFLSQETSYPDHGDPLWSCKHCVDHLNTSVSKKLAVLHVQEAHAIEKPVEGLDFFYQRSRKHSPRKPYFLGRGDDLNCWCLLCQSPRRRLWLRTNLMLHLVDKHEMRHPIEGVHWKPLPLVSRTTEEPAELLA